jgi:hypothetical protein
MINTSKAEAIRQFKTCLSLYNDNQEYDFLIQSNELKCTAICKPEQKYYLDKNETPCIEVLFNDGDKYERIYFDMTKYGFWAMLNTINEFLTVHKDASYVRFTVEQFERQKQTL